MSSTSFPIGPFESLLPKLATILELTQNPTGTTTPAAKQALLLATNDLKSTLGQAKELANALPGGEMLVDEQDEVIDLPKRIRDHKRQQLVDFYSLNSGLDTSAKMEVDSTASTPDAHSPYQWRLSILAKINRALGPSVPSITPSTYSFRPTATTCGKDMSSM